MSYGSTVARAVAVCLLLLIGGELFGCEMSAEMTCELGGAETGSDLPTDDHCLCCCFHVVVEPPSDLHASTASTLNDLAYFIADPAGAVSSPELPPRV